MNKPRIIRIDSDSIQEVKHDSLFGDIIVEFEDRGVPLRLVIEEEMAKGLAADIIEKILLQEGLAEMWADTEWF